MIVRPIRERSRRHLTFISGLSCIVCGKSPPNDPHHLKFAQPRARSMKTSDAFVVPICRVHHNEVELAGNEENWWIAREIDAIGIATALWEASINGTSVDEFI